MKTKKKDKMKSIDQKKIRDKIYITIIFAAFIAVTIWEIFDLPLPQRLITKLSPTDSLLAILQIQVTIALLPLAIIALITGISKDSLYGVPILKYVMYLRPALLKYRNIVFVQIIMIVISFIFTSLEMYNHLVLCLFVTIGNSTILMWDCFSLLSDFQCYKAEIRDYLIDKLRIEDFSILVNDIVKTKNEVSIEDLKDNLSVLNELLFAASNKAENSNHFESQYSTCIKKLFSSQKSDIFLCAVDALQMAYHSFNEKGNKLKIFSEVDYEFYNGLKYLNLTNARDLRVLDKLRYELFRNTAYSANNELYSFTALVYQFAVSQNVYPLNNISSLNTFIDKLNYWFPPYKKLTNLERNNKLYFFKILVDNKNMSDLDEKIFKTTNIPLKEELADTLFITLYLYYIAKCEPLADKERIQFCYEYINNNRDYFKQLIKSCMLNHILYDDIKLSYKLMKDWEILKINSMKSLVYNAVVNDFWTFSFLAVNSLGYSLLDTLEELTKGKEFSLYNEYFANENTSKLTQKYQGFCDLFGFEFTDTAISSLQSFLSEAFKKKYIQEAKYEYEAMKNNIEFLPNQSQLVEWYCDQLSNHFSNRPKKVMSKHIVLVNSSEYCLNLSKKENKQLQHKIRMHILLAVCKLIFSNINTEEVKFGDPIMPIIKELSEKSDCNSVDTVIGGRNCFPFSENEEAKEIIEKFGDYFLSKYISDALFFISKRDFFVNLSNIKVELLDISRDDLVKEIKEKVTNNNGIYTYKVVNNLYGYFTEDELVELIQNQQVKLRISCDLTYGFSSQCIGFGVILS